MDNRVQFDFEIEFTNGGALRGEGFRLDIAGDDIDDRALAQHLVADMRLLMVGAVRIRNKRIVREPHKRAPVDAEAGPARIVDLSHTIFDGLVTYKGLPAPVVCDWLSREASQQRYGPGTQFQIGRIDMVANTGTYVDTPFHRYADGEDLAAFEASRLVDLDAVVFRFDHRLKRRIDAAALANREVRGRAVLIHTGWDAHWNTEAYFDDPPYLTEDAARYLEACGARCVGIDGLNIDSTADLARPVHTVLLGAGIPIVEHLTGLAGVPDEGFAFSALPPKIVGLGTFPVRAIAKLR